MMSKRITKTLTHLVGSSAQWNISLATVSNSVYCEANALPHSGETHSLRSQVELPLGSLSLAPYLDVCVTQREEKQPKRVWNCEESARYQSYLLSEHVILIAMLFLQSFFYNALLAAHVKIHTKFQRCCHTCHASWLWNAGLGSKITQGGGVIMPMLCSV